jgi:hypothetical protein
MTNYIEIIFTTSSELGNVKKTMSMYYGFIDDITNEQLGALIKNRLKKIYERTHVETAFPGSLRRKP